MSLSRTTPTKVNVWGPFHERRRTSAGTGKVTSRMTIEYETDELLFELDEMVLGAPVADAIRGIIQDQFAGISARVSPETVERRKRYHKDRSSKSYKKRYAGGRTGETPPDPNSTQWGTDSGRLAGSVFVRDNPTDASYTVNVAANRLRADTFGPGFDVFLRDLAKYVPAIGNPGSMLGDQRFEAGVRDAVSLLITNAKKRGEAERALKLKKLAMARKRALSAFVSGAGSFGSGL